MIATELTCEPEGATTTLYLPAGLPGFPHLDRLRAQCEGDDLATSSALISLDDPGVRFVVVSPWRLDPGFELPLDRRTMHRLGLTNRDDAVALCLVTPEQPPRDSTVNLLAPIVVNRRTGEACQVVLGPPCGLLRSPLSNPV